MVVTAIAMLGSTASFASCSESTDNAASQHEQATFIPQAPDYNDATMWVTVAPSHHVLVVSGYSGSEYAAYKGFLNVGDIHSCEPWLYSECLAENIKVRAKEWRKLHH